MEGKRQGLTPTLLALLIITATLVLVGATVWMVTTPKRVPTQPPRPSSSLQVALPSGA